LSEMRLDARDTGDVELVAHAPRSNGRGSRAKFTQSCYEWCS
jgi:hypothetical protein